MVCLIFDQLQQTTNCGSYKYVSIPIDRYHLHSPTTTNMKGIAIFVILIAVQATSVLANSSPTPTTCTKAVVVKPKTNCGTIPRITDLSKACGSRTTDFSGLVVKIVTSLESLKTFVITSDAKVVVANFIVYVNALFVQVSIGLDLILAACNKSVITVDLQASFNKCQQALSVVLGFAGCSSEVAISVWISALVDLGKVVKDLVCDVNVVIKLLSVTLTVLLTEVIVALVVLLHAVVFVVHLVVVQLTVFLSVALAAVVKLLTGTLLQATTSCGGLVVKSTTCVSTGVNPVKIIVVDLSALVVVLVDGVKGLLNSVVGLLGGFLLSGI